MVSAFPGIVALRFPVSDFPTLPPYFIEEHVEFLMRARVNDFHLLDIRRSLDGQFEVFV
uniref:hypothetical protein n=1 Tax=Roseovarius indicus TaxID=540747 RepID=UPI003B52ABA7